MNDHLETINAHIAELRASINGEVVNRGRVIDHLLDFRLASEDPAFIGVVDALLASVPGQTVVENVWWGDALDELEHANLSVV